MNSHTSSSGGAALQIFDLNRPRFSALPKNWNPSGIPTFSDDRVEHRLVRPIAHLNDAPGIAPVFPARPEKISSRICQPVYLDIACLCQYNNNCSMMAASREAKSRHGDNLEALDDNWEDMACAPAQDAIGYRHRGTMND